MGLSMDRPHFKLVQQIHEKLQRIIHGEKVKIDGESLDVASVTAVSKYGITPSLNRSHSVVNRIQESVSTLSRLLEEGQTVYGVNTGFGGSADTRTSKIKALQSALLQHHHFGVLTQPDRGGSAACIESPGHALPPGWVRATMLTRCNTILRGHSAVSLHIIEILMALLRNNFTPVVPLRGSISASGDLSPLSYIAGTLTGNPDIYVQTGSESAVEYLPADKALDMISIQPAILGPKEGLGLMNGTATTAAVASLVLYEAHQLALLSQILTAMAVEALLGSAGSFDPFIANIRPHEGQIEAALNIRLFLQGSQLAQGLGAEKDQYNFNGMLFQDRYSLRTASQWLGPGHCPRKSTPWWEFSGGLRDLGHGKSRMSLQMIGRLMFAQCSELINPMLSNGLPPNLASDEPSVSFCMKGVDIGMASYMSELAFLANPVSSHVNNAEMNNQAVNSLALISARYTMQAVELVSLMSASYLYSVCQALDLRVMQIKFFKALEPIFRSDLSESFVDLFSQPELDDLHRNLWEKLMQSWSSKTNMDSEDRFNRVLDSSMAVLVNLFISRDDQTSTSVFSATKLWKCRALSSLSRTYLSTRSRFFESQDTTEFLGSAARKMYVYVRQVLKVPFHKGLEDHPTPTPRVPEKGEAKRTIGSWISIIYESLRSGDLHAALMEALIEKGSIGYIDNAIQNITSNGIEEMATKFPAGTGHSLTVKECHIEIQDGADVLEAVELSKLSVDSANSSLHEMDLGRLPIPSQYAF